MFGNVTALEGLHVTGTGAGEKGGHGRPFKGHPDPVLGTVNPFFCQHLSRITHVSRNIFRKNDF